MSKRRETLKKYGIPFKKGDDPRRKLKPTQGKSLPRKTYKVHIEMLEQAGYTPPTKETFSKMIGLLMALQEEDLLMFAENKYAPMWIRYIAIDIQDPKKRTDLMNNYRDWMFGKAAVTQNLNVSGEKSIFESINLDVEDAQEAEVVQEQLQPDPTPDIHELPPKERRAVVEAEIEKVMGHPMEPQPDKGKPKAQVKTRTYVMKGDPEELEEYNKPKGKSKPNEAEEALTMEELDELLQ